MRLNRTNTMIDIWLAAFLSWVFNPFIILPLTLISAHITEINARPMPFIFFLFVGAFPVFFTYLYEEYKHKENTLQFLVSLSRERRNTPLLVTLYSFLFNAILFGIFNEYLWQKISILFVIYAGFLYLANRYFDKASWHASMMAFSIFYLADKVTISLAFGLILLPVIFWSRVTLHKHSWLQLYLGTVIGLVVGILSWTIP